jgi:hypothetical protein
MSLMTALRLKPEPPPPPPKPKVTGQMIVGFDVYEWDKDDPISVHKARRQFWQCMTMGMAAFETVPVQTWHGMSTEEVSTRAFNPETEQIRMTAAYAGG